jgi:hypothetical protein
MRPSGRLFLDPIDVRKNKRAARRASQLVECLSDEADRSPELSCPELSGWAPEKPDAKEKQRADWELVAGVAESHPRLLVWLAEGRVTWYWNLFGTMIAMLRLIPGLSGLMWRYLFKPVERNAPWRPELHETILQKKRHECNARLRYTKDPVILTINPTPGLSAVTDGTTIAHPKGYRDLRRKIAMMSSGCIGVTGLAGSGKSTAIRDFCGERYGTPLWKEDPRDDDADLPGLRLMVEAPLLYDAREFLVHMYTCLCRAVLADTKLNVSSFRRHVFYALLGPRSIRLAALLRTLAGLGLLIGAAVLAYRAVTGGWPLSPWSLRTWEVIGAILVTVAALAVISWRTREALLEMRQITALATDAEERLERLHFQRTDTRGHGGTLGGPMGSGLNVMSTHALTQQMMTLPELVDDYRDFAERVAAALQASRLDAPPGSRPGNGDACDVRLVIGIDQVDQIEDAQAAGVFLTELSSVFGTPHCVYLIAVSPTTLATIDQRTVPLKTASGGIFDDMVRIEPLDVPGTLKLLDYRVVGLPAAFAALCYVLSGGLPRDLFRVARSIFTPRDGQSQKQIGLAQATRNVIDDEIEALKLRAVGHAAAQDIQVSPGLLMKLTDRDWLMSSLSGSAGDFVSVPEITSILANVSRMWMQRANESSDSNAKQQERRSAEICDNFLAGLFFLLTIRRLFTGGEDLLTKLGICNPDGICTLTGHDVLHGLARARLALSQDPYLATAILRDALAEHDPVADIDLRFFGSGQSQLDSASLDERRPGPQLTVPLPGG